MHPSTLLLNQLSLFFFFFFYIFIYLAVSGLCCGRRALLLRHAGFSLVVACGFFLSLVVARGLSCPVTCGILVPPPGIEPSSPALEGGFFTTGPPGKSLNSHFFVEVLWGRGLLKTNTNELPKAPTAVLFFTHVFWSREKSLCVTQRNIFFLKFQSSWQLFRISPASPLPLFTSVPTLTPGLIHLPGSVPLGVFLFSSRAVNFGPFFNSGIRVLTSQPKRVQYLSRRINKETNKKRR